MLRQHLGTHDRCRRVAGEEAEIVFKHHHVEALDPAVGGVDQSGRHEAVADGGIDQSRVHLPDLRTGQRQLVQCLQRLEPVRPAGKLHVQSQMPGRGRIGQGDGVHFRHQIGQGTNPLAFGALALHCERIGIVQRRCVQPGQALVGIDASDRVVCLLRRHALVDLVVNNECSAGVVPHQVELPAFQCPAHDHGGQIALLADLEALVPQVLRRQFGQQLLLGKVLAADHQPGRDGLGAGNGQHGGGQQPPGMAPECGTKRRECRHDGPP